MLIISIKLALSQKKKKEFEKLPLITLGQCSYDESIFLIVSLDYFINISTGCKVAPTCHLGSNTIY